MNGLKTTHLGGVPFDWDDWKWEQDGVKEAFYGLLSAWGIDPADSFIISGCGSTLNGANYDIAGGFISLNGEIYKVTAHSVAVALGGGDTHYWDEVVTYDPAGLEATANAGSVDTYEIREAKVLNGTIPTPTFMPMLADDIHQRIFELMSPKVVYQTIDLTSSTDVLQNDAYDGTGNFLASPQPPLSGSYLKYQILGKMINISFVINQVQTTTNTAGAARSMTIRSLPFLFKSSISQYGSCYARSFDTDTANGLCKIEVKDDLIVFNLTMPQGQPMEFNETAKLGAAPTKNYVTVGGTIPARGWDIVGNITAELN